MEFKEKMNAKPIRVAIEELQLHDLKNIEAAVEVQQNARPARHDEAIVPSPLAIGSESKRPIVGEIGRAHV